MTFDDFKEGFVAVLSQAIEQLSSSEDEEQPSDSTAGVESNFIASLINFLSCKRQPCMYICTCILSQPVITVCKQYLAL